MMAALTSPKFTLPDKKHPRLFFCERSPPHGVIYDYDSPLTRVSGFNEYPGDIQSSIPGKAGEGMEIKVLKRAW